jgi:polysaccharide export outer membrane protein
MGYRLWEKAISPLFFSYRPSPLAYSPYYKVSIMKKQIRHRISCVLFLTVLLCSTIAAAADGKQEVPGPKNDYIIGSGDVLEIMTWNEEDLTRQVAVRLDGKITFPLLDDIQASGRTTLELKEDIQERLGSFVEAPFVTVTLLQSGSQTFYILGEVINTGEYPIVKDLTVLQAFALAGGFTEWASKKEILLFRKENGIQKTIRINYKDLVKDQDFSNNVKIMANDTIIVP